jgi:hypothetical protein
MTANRQVGKAYVFFRSDTRPSLIKDKVRRIQSRHPLVDLYLPGKTGSLKGDNELLGLCKSLDSRGFNQALKIIIRDRPNFTAMVEMLVIIDSMIRMRMVEEGKFALITYKSKAKSKTKYRKLRVTIPSQPLSA